jgi:hypothetical protein
MTMVWVAVSMTLMAGLLAVVDDITMNALFDREAKLFVRIAYPLAGYYNERRRNT